MKKLLVSIMALSVFPLVSLAQTEDEPDPIAQDEVPVVEVPSPQEMPLTGVERALLWPISDLGDQVTACFPLYKSVAFTLVAEPDSTLVGSNILFTGTLENRNDFPLTEGTVRITVVRRGDNRGIVDQFDLPENFHLLGREQKSIKISWHVPESLEGGEYALIPTFIAGNTHLLAGGIATTDITDQAVFNVTSTQSGGVLFNSSRTLINGKGALNDQQLPHVGSGETADIRAFLRNTTNQEKTVRIDWREYRWDDFVPGHLLSEKTELVLLAPGEEKELAHSASPQHTAVSSLIVTASDEYQKSILPIRFVRDGITETRINFPYVESFPLRASTPNALTACFLTTGTLMENTTLSLSLNDKEGKVIQALEQAQTQNVQILRHEFVPESRSAEYALSAQSKVNGEVLASVQSRFACVNPEECNGTASANRSLLKILSLGIVLVVALIGFIWYMLWRRKKTIYYVFGFFMVGATFFLTGDSVEAAGNFQTSWVYAGTNKYQAGMTDFCPGGWTNADILDDNDGSERHLGEEDTDGGQAQLCLKADNPEITITSLWTTGSCPSNMTFTGVYDDAGSYSQNDDQPGYHSTNEENFRPDNSNAYIWCLGATGGPAGDIQARWVRWSSSTHSPSCAWDENRVLVGRDGRHNMNTEDISGNNQESLCIKLNLVNRPPDAPTLSGPTSGNVNTIYQYATQATDPDGDTIRYGLDWNNDGSVDQWTPSYVNSGTSYSTGYQWISPGTYNIKALTQDASGALSGWSSVLTVIINPPSYGVCGIANGVATPTPPVTGLCAAGTPSAVTPGVAPGPYSWICAGSGGGASASCSAPQQPAAPGVDLLINGSNGPLNVILGTPLNLSWSSSGATSCVAWGTGWSNGGAVATAGSSSTTATASDTYILQCTNGSTTATDSVQVILSNSLKVCQNSCSSGVQRGNTSSTQSFTLSRGGTQNLVACFNPSSGCSNSSGNVTGSTTWAEGGSNVVSLSGTNPKTVSGDNTGSENISATYNSQTANMNVTVTCIPSVNCSNAPGKDNYCQSESFSVDNGCGVNITCNGTKTCDYNWKEVAP